jgi:hypothetical protein
MTRRQRCRADLWKTIRAYAKAMRETNTLKDVENLGRKERAVSRAISKLEAAQETPK